MHPFQETTHTLRLELSPKSEKRYRAELRDVSKDGSVYDEITVDASEMKAWREHSRMEPDAVGAALAKLVLTPKIREFYQGRRGESLRVRIELRIIDNDNPLHCLPWELMHGPSDDGTPLPLAADENTPFSRFDDLQRKLTDPLQSETLNLLVVTSNPWDLQEQGMHSIEVEPLLYSLLGRLRKHSDAGRIKVTVLSGQSESRVTLTDDLNAAGWAYEHGAASLDSIQRMAETCNLLYLTAHGSANGLILENNGGDAEAVSADQIADKLTGASSRPTLIFLSACYTGMRPCNDAFASLGPKLHAAGIPAVIAMQDAVEMNAVRQVAADFFDGLFDPALANGHVDVALNRGRRLLYDRKLSIWAPPVLFCRLRDGRLFVDSQVNSASRTERNAKILLETIRTYPESTIPLSILRAKSGLSDRDFDEADRYLWDHAFARGTQLQRFLTQKGKVETLGK